MKSELLTVEADENGKVTYRNAEGKLHHPYGPAIIYTNGDKYHYINDQLHNENGPAIVWADGSKEFYINGKLHRSYGPAVVYADGGEEFWVNGLLMSRAEFKAFQVEKTIKIN